jgi:two-component system LytT family sensor kinase
MNRTEEIFNTKSNTLYWKCQFLGWGTASIYWTYVVFHRDNYGYFFTLINYILDISIGIILTHAYRFVALKLKWNAQLFLRIIPSIILLAILYMFLANLKWHYYWFIFGGKNVNL